MSIKAHLTVCGEDRGEIEVGENSFVGLLVRGLVPEASAKAGEMQRDLQAILDGEGEEG